MIPKIIHYCWFGHRPLPQLAQKCILSWKKFLPDYEIKEWNETNFDVNIIPYTTEAYKAKKYAFVSDYARFWILYKFGGLYFDTDVEVIKPIDDLIKKGPFMGCENGPANRVGVAPGLGLGVNPGLGLYKEILDLYSTLPFPTYNTAGEMLTVVHHTTNVLIKHGLKNINDIQQCAGVWIYPNSYFCPKDYITGELKIEKTTVCIHHYSASWQHKSKLYIIVEKIFGDRVVKLLIKIRKKLKK